MGTKINKENENIIKNTNEFLAGFTQIKIWGKQDYFIAKISAAAKSLSQIQAIKGTISVSQFQGFELIFSTLIIGTIIYVESLERSGSDLLPYLAVFAVAAIRVKPAATQITSLFVDLNFLKNAVDRLHYELFSLHPKKVPVLRSAKTEDPFKNGFEKLNFSRVSFEYPDTGKRLLSDISFDLTNGDIVGIKGPSGSGKSTLLKLILGLISSKDGTILHNGSLLDGFEQKWWREIAYLSQESFVINADLVANVSLEENLDHDKITEITSLLNRVKLKHLTSNQSRTRAVGEDGSLLSGGERQRLALVRALYSKRSVLILDESTSALDHELEKQLIEFICTTKRYALIIFVSHRDFIDQYCNKLLILDDGKLAVRSPQSATM